MNKVNVIAAAIFAFGLATPVLATEPSAEVKAKTKIESDGDGEYHRTQTRKVKSTDASGTTIKNKTEVEVDQESDGDSEKRVEMETSTDPKGLMNKSKTETTNIVKEKDGKVERTFRREVDGKVVEERNN